ncbi:MAG: GWxTD domain-containing protein [Bryobacteraceae bacterium]|jgi:GWxTD domain-containing protein
MTAKKFCVCIWVLGVVAVLPSAQADDKKDIKTTDAVSAQPETIAKPMSEKERRRREQKLKKELETPFRKWLQEDVAYIITDEERAAFKRLSTDEERESFIEQFWMRRDPTPDTVENEFKEEHYRRIAYANEHYASGIPGWKTDRGRIYITYGPPDENESHPSGGSYERPMEEGGGTTSTYPFEKWRYRYIEGIGTDVNIEFVDPTMTGEYRMTMDPSEKDALLYVPNAGLTLYEQMGLTSKNDRFSRSDGTHLGIGNEPPSEKMDQFNRLEQFAKLQKPPAIKFKDLEAVVNSRITYNLLPVKVHADYIRMTESTVLTRVTILLENKDLQFQQKEGVSKALVNMYARITSMSRRPVNVWEEPVSIEVPAEMTEQILKRSSIYSHAVFLAPGTYRLNVVVKDVTGGTMNNYEMPLHVPRFEEDKLAASSLILADLIEKVPTRNIGTGQFVIGDSKVRPRLNDTFHRDEKMGIYVQFYNFQADDKTGKPDGSIDYEIVRNGSNQKIFDLNEDVKSLPGAAAQQVTVEKLLSLQTLEPGQYTLRMTVTDRLRKQTLTPSATFTVN